MFDKITDQYDEVTLSLSQKDTVWNHWNFIKQHNIVIPYITDNGKRDFNKIFIIRLLTAFPAVVIVNISTNILVYFIFSIIWTSIVFISILDANYYIFLDAISTFDVHYKLINMAIGITCMMIVTSDAYDTNGSLSYLILLTISHTLSVFGNTSVVFLISLFDGFAMKYSYKLLFGIQSMLLYCVQMMYLYLAKNSKHSHTDIFGVDVDFRIIGISTIISTIFFIGKQLGRTAIFHVASSTILCHIPIKIHKTIDARSVTVGGSALLISLNSKTTTEMTELNISLLDEQSQSNINVNEDSNIFNPHANISNISKNNCIKSNKYNDSNPNSSITIGPASMHDDAADDLESVSNTSSIVADLTLRASQMIRAMCEKLGYHIIVESEITVFYALFKFLFGFSREKSLIYANFLGSKRVIGVCVWSVIIWEIYVIIRDIIYGTNSFNLWQCIALMGGQLLFMIVVIIIFGNLNYQIFFYYMKRFKTWWILCDSLTMLTAMVLISKEQKEYEFGYDFKGYKIWMSYYIVVLEYIILGILCPLGITMIQGIIGKYSNISRLWINLPLIIAIGFWSKWAIWYLLDKNTSYVIIFGDNIEYGISLNHIAFIKAIDLVVWFMVQLYRQNKHPRMIAWNKIKCVWTKST